MSNRSMSGREFTGKHMLAVMLAFFGVIIAVNLTMATLARTSWSGLVVKNTYVASQEFNARAQEGRRQAGLGYAPALAVEGGTLRFSLADRDGSPVRLSDGIATLRRPVGDADDATVVLTPRGAALEAALDAADGAWIVEVHATIAPEAGAGLDHPWRETRRILLRAGTMR